MKFSIDGQEFNVIVTELARKGRVSESKLSGRRESHAHFWTSSGPITTMR